jgi:large repetitive protein
MSTPGQNTQLTFAGTSGHRVSLMASSTTVPSATMSIRKPDGTTLGSVLIQSGGTGFLDVLTLPTTGTYTIVVDPGGTNTGGTTLTLYDVPADATGSITPGGSSVGVTLSTPGQNAGLTFAGTNGQRVSVKAASTSIASAILKILKPDGSQLGAVFINNLATGFLDVLVLPATGTYAVVVDPQGTNVGSTTLTAYDVPADTTGMVTVNGSAVAVTLSTPGQNGTLTFSGSASEQVTVHWTNNSFGAVFVKLIGTNGTTVLAQALSSASSFNLSQVTLSSTGTYTVSVDPSSLNTGTLNISVTSP